MADFEAQSIHFFKTLHLINEDFRLVKQKVRLHQDLTFLLFSLSFFLDDQNSAFYCEYYLQLVPETLRRFKRSTALQNLAHICSSQQYFQTPVQYSPNQAVTKDLYFNSCLPYEVFDIFRVIRKLLKNESGW